MDDDDDGKTSDKSKHIGVCYNERMLQRTVSVNKIRTLQRTQDATTNA